MLSYLLDLAKDFKVPRINIDLINIEIGDWRCNLLGFGHFPPRKRDDSEEIVRSVGGKTVPMDRGRVRIMGFKLD